MRTVAYLPYYRDPMLDDVVALILNDPRHPNQIADDARLARSTIKNWVNGKTYRPQAFTMTQVLGTLGKRLAIMEK